MLPKQAKAIRIEEHKGQFRKPTVLTYDEVKQLFGHTLMDGSDTIYPNGTKLRYDTLREEFLYYLPYHIPPIAVA